MTSVMWFRRDLRLTDNRALAQACKESKELLLLFQVNSEQFLEDSPNFQAFLSSVAHFQKTVDAKLHLQILYGEIVSCFSRLKQTVETWDTIYFNQDQTGFGAQRDQQMQQFFDQQGITVKKFSDHYLHSGSEIKNKSGEAYKVFTPYYKQWLQLEKPGPVKVELKKEQVICKSLFPEEEKQFNQLLKANSLNRNDGVGEKAAREQLEKFVSEELQDYYKKRDFPYKDSTSHLSAYLRTGELSVRTIWNRLRDEPDSQGKQIFEKELCWRDFYQMIYMEHPHQKNQPIQKDFSFIEWENNQEYFKKWQEGVTGFPIVDAAMRQLKETGWMHNRLRMITASFLTKDLLIDWRWGEVYFQKMLIDYDSASNIGGWQWAASTGTDAVPYFRIFNPTTQAKKFDPTGAFIREYVSELKNVPTDLIHEPYKMTTSQQKQYEVSIGQDYPLPIVTHQEARKLAIARYEASKEIAREQSDEQ